MKKEKRFMSVGLLLTLLIVFFVSCTGKQDGVEINPTYDFPLIPTTGAPNIVEGLEGVTWYLDTYQDAKGNQIGLIPGTQVIVEFKAGQVSGNAGCNNYFAPFLVDGEKLIIEAIAATEMYCLEPANIMEQEQGFLAALDAAARYHIGDGRLQIINQDGETILVLTVSK